MAAKRSGVEDILDVVYDLLRVLPWWAGPIVAGVVYAGLRWFVPWMFSLVDGASENPVIAPGQVLTTVSVTIAPWAGLFVLIIWLCALLAKYRDRARVDRQAGIETIRDLSWREFEELMGEVFRRQGYAVMQTPDGGGGADGGVDLFLKKDGAMGVVQCKHWKTRRVGVKPVRELHGVAVSLRAAESIFVTSGSYTPDAEAFGRKVAMRLIDGATLEEMVRQVQAGKEKRGLARDDVVKGKVAAAAIDATPACPNCGDVMVMRLAKRGANAGKRFWGCSCFPACRGTRMID